MSLKTCLSFDEEIEAEVEYAARAGSSNINSNGGHNPGGIDKSRCQIVLLGLECRGQPASQRDITLLFLSCPLLAQELAS